MGIWTDLFESLLCTQSSVMQTLVLQALYGLSLGTATKLTGSAVLSLVTEKRGMEHIHLTIWRRLENFRPTGV